MFGFFSHGLFARNDAPIRQRNGGFDFPSGFASDPRLVAWAIHVGLPSLARFNLGEARNRGELDDIDFTAAVTASSRRPTLIRRVIAALRGGRTADPAKAMSGTVAVRDRRLPEARYTDGTRSG